MSIGFQTHADIFGNLYVQAGVVVQAKTGIVLHVGGGGQLSQPGGFRPDGLISVSSPAAVTFVGGSGNNLIASGLEPAFSGPQPPIGFFTPGQPGIYQSGDFTIEVTGPSDATLSDGTDVVAILTTGGTAPIGDYAATTYGEDTYNGGDPFTITLEGEGGIPNPLPTATYEVPVDLFPEGTFTSTDGVLWEHSDVVGMEITIDGNGRAELSDGTDVVAVREEGPLTTPDGLYIATAYGEETYNPTPEPADPDPDPDPDADPDPTTAPDPIAGETPTTEDDPEVILPTDDVPDLDPEPEPDPDPEPDPEPAGQPWTVSVTMIPVPPRSGHVYVKITETAGTLTAADGPYFGDLPENTATEFFVPVVLSDGLGGLEPLIQGALIWDPEPPTTIPHQLELTAQTAATDTSAMTRGLADDRAIENNFRSWPIQLSAPQGCAVIESSNTAGNQHIYNYSSGNYPLPILSCEGDARNAMNFSRRHLISMHIYVSNIVGDGVGWIVFGETYNKGTVADPTKKGFGIKITTSGLALWVHDGTTLTLGDPTAITGLDTLHKLVLAFEDGELSGILNTTPMDSVSGGPSGQGAANDTAVSFQALTGATNNRCRFGVLYPKSITR